MTVVNNAAVKDMCTTGCAATKHPKTIMLEMPGDSSSHQREKNDLGKRFGGQPNGYKHRPMGRARGMGIHVAKEEGARKMGSAQ